jgi:hypothetical protein
MPTFSFHPRVKLVQSISFVAACSCLLAGISPATSSAQRFESQAIPGRPFGVGAITYTMPADPMGGLTEPRLEEQDGRAHYPAFSAGALNRLLASDNAAVGEAGTKTVFFLFTGDAPLRLTVHTPVPTTVTLRPEPQAPRVQNRLLQRWWRSYSDTANDLSRNGDYPPLIHSYLTGMLGYRLGLRPPLLTRIQQDRSADLRKLVDVLMGTEQLHEAMLRETMLAGRVMEPADQPVPEEIAWRPPSITLGPLPEIEPIAHHVPEECFYVRFGSFENYIWLEELLTNYGGDVSRMVTARGHDAKAGDRVRKQLSLPQTALAKLLGGTLIADVALIGRDMYLQNGAAVGVLFHARNGTLLSVSINQQRSQTAAAGKDAGATLETVRVGGRDVSFLATPDNSVRSFYAVDGDFHLVTTSRAIVERFFEAGDDKRALADSPEFQHARAMLPLSRNDTIFSFLSTSFFSGLLAPQYQIELIRRTQALVDLELVRLAQLAAEAEGQPATNIDDLIAGGFLPTGFGRQADGSGPIVEASRAIDSLRGARGTFLPIPDVELRFATATEVAQYQSLAQEYFEKWQQLDPLVAAIRRESLPDKRERLIIDANISPIAEEKYGKWLSMLGPPVTQRVVPRAGDVISAQAFVTGGQFSNLVPPHLLFVGVQDVPVEAPTGKPGLLQWLKIIRATPGYIGAWPKPGYLDWLLFRRDEIPPDGLMKLPFDAWRWQGDGFAVVSFQREVIDTVVPQLLIAEADDPAQLRIQVGDLAQSRLRDWVNGMYFERAWQTSVANTRLLHSLTQQLRVPPDQSLAVAEQLLDTHLVCPLGGKYELVESRGGQPVWHSTAWAPAAPSRPLPTYDAPLLQWFRGMELGLTKSANQITVRSQIDLQR